jgi:hypothetical protein
MPAPAKLVQTFASDFADFRSSADGSIGWQTTLPHHLRNLATNGELQYYADASVGSDPFSVRNGVLSITARRAASPGGLPYQSGVITTEGSFAQRYGYFSMRAAVPTATGLWPAFWMLPASLSGTREIDVMEGLPTDPPLYRIAVHSPANGNAAAAIARPDRSQGFHEYGLYWTPRSLSFYFDGTMVAAMPTPADMNAPMFMIANLAVSGAVNTDTPFPARMRIQAIDAYAYDPTDPGPLPALHVTVPTELAGRIAQPLALAGVGIADADASGAGAVTVSINDKALGLLHTSPVAGVAATGQSSWNLRLTGSLAAVNLALATLSYQNIPTGPDAPGQDTVTVAATDAAGNMDAERIAVGLAPGPQLAFITLTPGTPRYIAPGPAVFVIGRTALADPGLSGGQATHIIDFHSIAQDPDMRDVLALHGFDPGARLVFDHYAAPGGVPDETMQYYRVASDTGSSPIFMVQMAGGASGHLGAFDYGFYPS